MLLGTKVVCFFGETGTLGSPLGGPLGGPFGGPLGLSTGSSVVWGWRDHWGPHHVLLWWEMVQGKGDGGKGWLLGVRAGGATGEDVVLVQGMATGTGRGPIWGGF